MYKVAIVTDSNAGITLEEQTEDLFVVPMPFIIDSEEYFENVNLTQSEFYEKLKANENISTSQPSPYSIQEVWDMALKTHDAVVYIPMSSGLSATYATSFELAKNYNGKVIVVDNQRISVTQKQSVYEALDLAKNGLTAEEIANFLTKTKLDASIYITVNTLKYLRKGGRVTPAGALLGTILNIKPILQIHGGKLDAYAKVLSFGQAKQRMINAIKNDINTVFKEYYDKNEIVLAVAHTNSPQEAEKFKEELKKSFPELPIVYCDPLSLSVACHIGTGSLAVVAMRVAKKENL